MLHLLHKGILNIGKTYSLIRRLSGIDGSNVEASVLDRVMYSGETLPPLGKEYWRFLFLSLDDFIPKVQAYQESDYALHDKYEEALKRREVVKFAASIGVCLAWPGAC